MRPINASALPAPAYRAPPDDGLQMAYVDAAVLVVNKPAGLLSVPGRGDDKQDCLSQRVQLEYPDALSVHRLDMQTSGLLLMARGIDMQRRMSLQFARRQVEKRYLAVVDGELAASVGEIDLPLSNDWPRRPLQKVDRCGGKTALTRYQVLCHDRSTNASYLLLWPLTGRTHQLRVHLAAIGHPILGDPLYGSAASAAKAGRLLLHADRLTFAHPETGQAIHCCCPAPFQRAG